MRASAESMSSNMKPMTAVSSQASRSSFQAANRFMKTRKMTRLPTMASVAASVFRKTEAAEASEEITRSIYADLVKRSRRVSVEYDEPLLQEEGWLVSLVKSTLFQAVVLVLTAANTISMGLEADSPTWIGWIFVEQFFVTTFVIELGLKVAAFRKAFFEDWYNILDLFLAFMGCAECFVLGGLRTSGAELGDLRSLSVLRLLRLSRLARVLRLVKGMSQLRMVFEGVGAALKATFWVFLTMCLFIYVASIFCMAFFGGDGGKKFPGFSRDEEDIQQLELVQEFNPHMYFGSMRNSFVTLFSMAMLTIWTEVVLPIYWYEPLFVFFFVGFFLMMFGLLNVIVGLIVDKVLLNSRLMEHELFMIEQTHRLALLEKLKEVAMQVDEDENGVISTAELRRLILAEDGALHQLLEESDLQLPSGFSATELLTMLDSSGEGDLSSGRFIQSFFRLIDSNDFQRACTLQMEMHETKAQVLNSHQVLEERLQSLEQQLQLVLARLPTKAEPQPPLQDLVLKVQTAVCETLREVLTPGVSVRPGYSHAASASKDQPLRPLSGACVSGARRDECELSMKQRL